MTPCYWISSPNFSRGCLKRTLMMMLGMLWRVTRLRGWCPRLRRICRGQSSSGTECSCSRCTWSGLSILISSARQSLWLVLSAVSTTMHYVLYVCVCCCCLHIIILSKGLSVNHVFLPTFIFIFTCYSRCTEAPRRTGHTGTASCPRSLRRCHLQNMILITREIWYLDNSTDLVPFCTAPRRVWRCVRGHRCPPGSGESAGLGGRSTRGPGAREIERAARIMRSGQT